MESNGDVLLQATIAWPAADHCPPSAMKRDAAGAASWAWTSGRRKLLFMAKRGILGGYLDTIIYESSLLAERRGQDRQHQPKVDQAKRLAGSPVLHYRRWLQVVTHYVMAALARGLKGRV
jgi:hypothetical protein